MTSEAGAPTAPKRAGRREWLGLAVLTLACLLYVMDLTVLHLAVPAISRDLRPSSVELLWIIDIYGFMVAGFLITMGTLGDRIGRRKVLLIGGAAFGGASILAAFSPTAETLILSRALLGIAGATIAPSTLSLIFTMFEDPKERSTAVGLWVSAFSAGGVIGPILGGILLSQFWWGSVFLLAVPVMAALLLLGPRLLPEYRDPDAGRIDLVSVVLSLTAILSLIFGLKQTAQDGPTPLALGSIAVGLVVGVAWVRRQLSSADPMFDLSLFRIPRFATSLAINFLAIFLAIGFFLFVAQYMQLVLGLTPLEAGLWSLPEAVGFILGPNLAPRIVRHIRPAYLMAGGFLLAGAGLLLLSTITASSPNGLALVVISSAIIALGLGPVFGLTTELIVGSAPPSEPARPRDVGDRFGGRRRARALRPRFDRGGDLPVAHCRGAAGRRPGGRRGGRQGHARGRRRGRGDPAPGGRGGIAPFGAERLRRGHAGGLPDQRRRIGGGRRRHVRRAAARPADQGEAAGHGTGDRAGDRALRGTGGRPARGGLACARIVNMSVRFRIDPSSRTARPRWASRSRLRRSRRSGRGSGRR